MCGIAGYFGPCEPASHRVDACLWAMRRRGPDARGVYRHSFGQQHRVCLLHTRLSIIDLDARSDQPFRFGSFVLTYNGELYNYRELKEEMDGGPGGFRTEGDTEVLIRVLAEHGWSGLDRCEGMWAFALYDERTGGLTLSRDRFGEKPLYLLDADDGLYFGSEIKFIAALSGSHPPINYDHLYRYLVNGYKSLYKVKDTFFTGVEELPAAHVLQLDPSGRRRLERYWRPAYTPDNRMTYPDAVAGARSALHESMRLRLRADLPVAFCLSGGVDSNGLVAIAQRRLGYDVHGFTVVNDDDRYNESAEVQHAVRELGIRHTVVPLTTEAFCERLAELIRQHDAPVYTISYYIHWLLMRAVADAGYRVSVSGTGADELFTGYYDHHNLWLHQMNGHPRYAEFVAAWRRHVAPLVRNPYLQEPLLYDLDPGCRAHVYLGSERAAGLLREPWSEPFAEEQYSPDLLRSRMLNELFHEAVPVLLHEDDLNTMYFSIENRSPYLDRRLFEFCCRIPTEHLLRDGYAKVVLRDALAGLVPDKVLWNRRKVGFNAPILSLLDTRNAHVREWVLDDGPIYRHVRRDRVEELLSKDSLPNSESKFLFSLVNARVFLEQHAGVGARERHTEAANVTCA